MRKQQYDTIIVANGSIPQSEWIVDMLRSCKVIIACDGATNELLKLNILPTYVVGDLDSIDPKHLENESIQNRIVHISEQESNDLSKAALIAQGKGAKQICIIGATGLREDHTLGNISLLANFAAEFDDVCLLSDYGYFKSITKSTCFSGNVGQQVSIFSLTPSTRISTKGLKYTISNRPLLQWWEGTLNEVESKDFNITLHQEGTLLLYFAHS